MANTLTGLTRTIYLALDVVSRELVGFVAAVTRNSSAERAAVGQPVTYPIVSAVALQDITPGRYGADDGDHSVGTGSLTISKSKYYPIRWTGEEQLLLKNGGTYNKIIQDQFAMAFRTIVNAVEADLAAQYVNAARAYGTPGTTPFGTAGDFSDFANILRLLDENGAPTSDRHLVLGSAAIANVRGKQSVLFKANEAGTEQLLREGIIGKVEGLSIHNSAQVLAVTKGTGASYQTNNVAGYAAGDTGIALDTGSGTVLAGDVVTFAGDANKYVNGTALAGGSIALNKPGLRAALADNVAMTVGNSYVANLGFSRNAIHLVTRAPAMPEGGDEADDVMEVIDPVSGLAFQIAVYRERRQVKFEVGLAWGFKTVKSEHLIILQG